MASVSEMASQNQPDGGTPTATIVSKGQVFGDERHSETVEGEKVFNRKYEVVYQDESRLLLRAVDDPSDYRTEAQDQFRTGIGSRWKPLNHGEQDELLASLPDLAPVIADLKEWQRTYEDQTGQVADHKAEALSEAIDIISGYDPEAQDWENVEGIGEKTAENLHNDGFVTEADIRAADDEQLLAVDGIGEQTIEHLHKALDDKQTTLNT